MWRYLIIVGACLASAGANSQNNYLLSLEHREPRRAEVTYFYLQALEAGADLAQTDVLTLDDAAYRVYYFRFREPSASSYFGCSLYGDEAAGETLSLNDLLTQTDLRMYDQTQRAIEAECNALFDNRGRQHALLTIDLNGQDRIKMLKIQLDVCTCKVSRDRFSALTDTLAMPRKVIQTGIFSAAEKSYWQSHAYAIVQHALVRSCLPQRDRYARSAYQLGQR